MDTALFSFVHQKENGTQWYFCKCTGRGEGRPLAQMRLQICRECNLGSEAHEDSTLARGFPLA